MSIEKVLYTASATSVGGREGRSTSSDKVLDVQLSTPSELGALEGLAPTLSNYLPLATLRAF